MGGKSFVPKTTITIQMTFDIRDKMLDLLDAYGLTKTKLLEKLINDAYSAEFVGKKESG